MTQNFKGDATELKMQAVGDPLFEVTDTALDEMYSEAFDAAPFLLAMYDDGRMPFSQRINRDTFVEFIRQALSNFPFTGTFEVYLTILRAIFGEESEIRFYVDTAGALEIDVEAVADATFTFFGREFIDGAYTFFDMITQDGVDTLVFRGIIGIETEYELNLLFSELMPVGITPTITLGFFEISDWVDDEDNFIEDDDRLGIIFIEGGA